jgi:hypothetical protein
MKVTTMVLLLVGCSRPVIERSPSFDADTNLRTVKSSGLLLDREFSTASPEEDVSICGELYHVNRDFYVRSKDCADKAQVKTGLSKIPADLLLPQGQLAVWTEWMDETQTQMKASSKPLSPEVCFIGRGHGDPCSRNGALIRRVRRFTSDPDQFSAWRAGG